MPLIPAHFYYSFIRLFTVIILVVCLLLFLTLAGTTVSARALRSVRLGTREDEVTARKPPTPGSTQTPIQHPTTPVTATGQLLLSRWRSKPPSARPLIHIFPTQRATLRSFILPASLPKFYHSRQGLVTCVLLQRNKKSCCKIVSLFSNFVVYFFFEMNCL